MPATPMRDFALEVHFSKWEFTARHNLAGSDGENTTLGALLALATDAERAVFDGVGLGYTETFGSPALRAEIAGTYDHVTPEQLLCCAGAEEAIYVAMHVLLTAADHAIVIAPNYQSAETIPMSLCEVTALSLDPDRHWDLDVDQLTAALRPNTKLVSLNFPNNPTGKIIPRASFDAIVELCRARGIWLFSDEAYRGLERNASLRLPQAVDAYERGISLNVMSKAYGLAGLRIGWLACRDRTLLSRCERLKHFLSICNSAPSEVLAWIALRHRAAILARNIQVIRDNLALLEPFFRDYAHLFDWWEPEGGCIAFIRYKGTDGVEAFCERAVEESGVLLLPGSVFRSELAAVPTQFCRIGFGRSIVPAGLETLRDWLKRTGR